MELNFDLVLKLVIAILSLIAAYFSSKTIYRWYISTKKMAKISGSPGALIQQVEKGGTVIGQINVYDPGSPKNLRKVMAGLRGDRHKIMMPPEQKKPRKVRVSKLTQADAKALVQDVKSKLLDNNEAISPLLSKCIDIAKALNIKTQARWLERELYGYKEETKSTDFPDYRRVKASANMEIHASPESGIGPKEVQVEKTLLINFPASQIEEIVRDNLRKGVEQLIFWIPTPEDWKKLAKKYRATIENGQVPFIVDVLSLKRILSELRLSVHKFVDSI